MSLKGAYHVSEPRGAQRRRAACSDTILGSHEADVVPARTAGIRIEARGTGRSEERDHFFRFRLTRHCHIENPRIAL